MRSSSGCPARIDLQGGLAGVRHQIEQQGQAGQSLLAEGLCLVEEDCDVAARVGVVAQELRQPVEQIVAVRRSPPATPSSRRTWSRISSKATVGCRTSTVRTSSPSGSRSRRTQGGLAGADLADQEDQPGARADPAGDGAERLLDRRVEVQEARIGRDAKGLVVQPEEIAPVYVRDGRARTCPRRPPSE